MAVLTWIKSKNVFLKVQEGTGDNLLHEDIAAGYVDYVLWSTFQPECIDLDSTLDMECIDSGMVMDKVPISADSALPECYCDAFRVEYNPGDVIWLMHD